MLRTMREMKHDAVRLDQSARDLVRRVVSDHCAHRAWSLHVCHVRTNHVHVVLSCDAHPADAMRQLKAWTTRRLRETQQKPPRATVWTEGGSRRWLWDIDSLKRAIRYVEDAQGGELR
jgi:REP element-mobilizing transposase RayT